MAVKETPSTAILVFQNEAKNTAGQNLYGNEYYPTNMKSLGIKLLIEW